MRSKILISLISLLSLILISCATESKELVICSSLPLNGGQNARAQTMSRAIEMAIDEQNQQGGVTMAGLPYQLRYVAMDDTAGSDKWDTAQEERNARAAIAEHDCLAYIGPLDSQAATISMPILNRVQMPMISPGNSYPGLTKPRKGLGDEPWIYAPLGPEKRNYCRVIPADDIQIPPGVMYLKEKLQVKSVYILHDTEVYGKGAAEIFHASATELGLNILAGPKGIDKNATDYTELVQDILDKKADLVYFGGTPGNSLVKIWATLKDMNYTGKLMGPQGIVRESFIQQLQQLETTDPGRIYATIPGMLPYELQGAGKELYDKYKNRYQEEPGLLAPPSYEAAKVVIEAIIDAIEKGEMPDPNEEQFLEKARPAILKAMKDPKERKGFFETWAFDENCDTTNTTISIVEFDGKQFKSVSTSRQ